MHRAVCQELTGVIVIPNTHITSKVKTGTWLAGTVGVDACLSLCLSVYRFSSSGFEPTRDWTGTSAASDGNHFTAT